MIKIHRIEIDFDDAAWRNLKEIQQRSGHPSVCALVRTALQDYELQEKTWKRSLWETLKAWLKNE
jgi:hypothetical protein